MHLGINRADAGGSSVQPWTDECGHDIRGAPLAEKPGIAKFLVDIDIGIVVLEPGDGNGSIAQIALVGIGIAEAGCETSNRLVDDVGMRAFECLVECFMDGLEPAVMMFDAIRPCAHDAGRKRMPSGR